MQFHFGDSKPEPTKPLGQGRPVRASGFEYFLHLFRRLFKRNQTKVGSSKAVYRPTQVVGTAGPQTIARQGSASGYGVQDTASSPSVRQSGKISVRQALQSIWKTDGIKMLLVNVLASLLTLACYHAATVNPTEDVRAQFLGYGTPIMIVVQLVFALIWALRAKPPFFLVPVVTLAFGWPHIRSTLAININPDTQHHDLKVVSYNIRMLQGYGLVKERTREEARALLTWLKESGADIICLQEYYNNPNRFGFDFNEEMRDVGLKHHFFSETLRNYWIRGNLGMTIYSRYPIIRTKTLHRSDGPNNQIIYADVKTPKGIIRVYSVHLHSLQLKERELKTDVPSDKMKENAKSVGSKLKQGFLERSFQVNQLDSSVARSPYPVLVCGDFNDLPYSYTYTHMRNRLLNAFEEGGSGFDFSFNGKIPFLRIDNQFCSKEFKVLNFETWNQVALSDHFPIVGWYQLNFVKEGARGHEGQ